MAPCIIFLSGRALSRGASKALGKTRNRGSGDGLPDNCKRLPNCRLTPGKVREYHNLQNQKAGLQYQNNFYTSYNIDPEAQRIIATGVKESVTYVSKGIVVAGAFAVAGTATEHVWSHTKNNPKDSLLDKAFSSLKSPSVDNSVTIGESTHVTQKGLFNKTTPNKAVQEKDFTTPEQSTVQRIGEQCTCKLM